MSQSLIDQRVGSPAGTGKQHPTRLGLLCGAGAYLWWGFVAVYLKLVSHVPPLEVLSHRIVWSLVFVLLLTVWFGAWAELNAAWRDRRTMTILTASTAVLSINWFVFIMAVVHDHVVDASLGYFITPLVNVLFGIVLLRERPRFLQEVGLIVAAAGVVYLAVSRGQFPWIAISLALTFGSYGLFRKVAPVTSVVGLTIETTILLIPALSVIVYTHMNGAAQYDLRTWLLLSFAGIVTAVPLLLFAAAAKRLRLMTMGFLQFLAPTVQFLLAVFAYHEPFGKPHLISFSLIWTALAIYSFDAYAAYRTGLIPAVPPTEEP